ncbi:MAG: TonB-dependent receptor [Acidobacteriota bacterium]
MRGIASGGWRASWGLALVAAFALAPAAVAQTDVTTGRISGVVSASDGSALPGASVEAKNQETGLTKTTTTDSKGAFVVINLPPGRYTLTATLEGFKTGSRPDIRLDIGVVPTIDFRMPLSTVTESITVTTTELTVETTNTTASTTIQTEQVKQLPVNGRNFQDLVLLTPETRKDPESRGTTLVSGQRGINTNTTVDGMDFDNGFFGGTFGSAEGRAPLAISQESVKEISVIRNGASVEYGPSGGGVISVITKSGTNDFHGSGFYYIQPHSTVARLSNGREAPDQKKKQYGFSVGGPILRDQLFFFGSYDQQKQDVGIPVNGVLLDPAISNQYPNLASDPTYVQTQDGRVIFGRVDYQLSSSQRLMGRLNYAQYEGDHGTSSSQSQTSGHNGIEGLQSHAYVGSWNSQWGSALLNDLNGQYVVEQTPRAPVGTDFPEIRYGSFSLGSTSFLPITSTAERSSIGDVATYLIKNHVIKGGAEYNKTSISQIFKGNWRGVYVFAGNNLPALLAGKWTQFFQFGGLNGRTADEAGTAAFSQKELAFFAQDQWFLSSKFTVSAGVRYERLDNPDNPILNSEHVLANGQFALDGQIPDQNNKWSPRVGFSYAPDPKTAIRLSAGRFWARTPGILFAQLLTANGLTGTQYTINATATTPPTDPLAPGWGDAFNPNQVAPINFQAVPTPSRLGVFTTATDYTDPVTNRITLGVDREIITNTIVGIEGTYAEAKNLERLNDPNLVLDGSVSTVNGQPRYSSTRPNSFYGRISTYTTDARSKYEAVTLNLQHRFTQDLQFFVGATWSEDKDNDSNERNFAGAQAEDLHNIDNSYSWANRDQRWRVGVNANWNTPWWGIGLSGTYRWSTGSPYTATTGADENKDGFFNDRPTIGGVHQSRNQFRQPNFMQLDFRVAKTFTLGPVGLTAIAECFNCANNTNRFVTNFTWGTGQTPSSTFGIANGVYTVPRTLQFAARVDF